jgi:hypothetical protein
MIPWRTIGKWLVHTADPLGPRTAAPRRSLSPEATTVLVSQAEMHGVIAAVLRNFSSFDDARFAEMKRDAVERHRALLMYARILRHHGEAVMAELVDSPVAMVKGPVFARTIYPNADLRAYTDIDLLAAPQALPRLASALKAADFTLVESELADSREEWKWLHRGNSLIMIEVHTNLVHAPSLRPFLSLSYEDIAGDAESPAGLLAIAIIHGGTRHRYDRLRQVVDICQAARNLKTAAEEERFERIVARTGARLAAVTGLDLAARLFREPRCADIARAVGPVRHARLTRALITRAVVTSTTNSMRELHSWRRGALRGLLKRSRPLSTPDPSAATPPAHSELEP